MTVETLGEAWQHGWRLHVKCNSGKGDGLKKHRECTFSAELDMDTLLMAKGPSFPPQPPRRAAVVPALPANADGGAVFAGWRAAQHRDCGSGNVVGVRWRRSDYRLYDRIDPRAHSA